jgi:hypothetical protein
MTRSLLFLTIGISSLTLAFGWTQAGFPAMGLVLLILATLWLAALKRNLAWASALGFATLTVFSALGVTRGLSFFFALAGILGGMVAWDLEHFSRRLESAAVEDDRAALQRRHFFQLAVILLIGVGMAYLALAVQIRLQFGLAVGMALVAIGGLGALVNWLRKKED